MTARLPASLYLALGALTTLLVGLWLMPMGDTRRADPPPTVAALTASPPLAWTTTGPVLVIVATQEPTATPTWTPVPTAPVASAKTPRPPACTMTPQPGQRCDVLIYQRALTATPAPTAPPVLCDIVLQTPNPYGSMPGRYCWWATATPTVPPTPTPPRPVPTTLPELPSF